jgi:hypothetical protein
MDMREAKDLFFRYDGSRFYMSRDGVEATSPASPIPVDAEQWLKLLAARGRRDRRRFFSRGQHTLSNTGQYVFTEKTLEPRRSLRSLSEFG